jgi:hypothetical protein
MTRIVKKSRKKSRTYRALKTHRVSRKRRNNFGVTLNAGEKAKCQNLIKYVNDSLDKIEHDKEIMSKTQIIKQIINLFNIIFKCMRTSYPESVKARSYIKFLNSMKEVLLFNNDDIKRKYPVDYQTLWKEWYKRAISEINYLIINNFLKHLKPYRATSKDDTCPICLNDIKIGLSTPCGHHFHDKCIVEWLQYKKNCPLCRTKIIR